MEKEDFIEPINQLLFSKGYIRVTMQMVASELGVSKKTLYKHFDSKEDMIIYILKARNKDFRLKWESLKKKKINALLMTIEMRKYISEKTKLERQKEKLQELNSHYPGILKEYLLDLSKTLEYCINDAIKWGKKQNIYLDYLDEGNISKIISFFYIESRLQQSDIYTDAELDKFTLTFYFLIIRGCLTNKGLDILEELQQEDVFKQNMNVTQI